MQDEVSYLGFEIPIDDMANCRAYLVMGREKPISRQGVRDRQAQTIAMIPSTASAKP